jgi:4-hydroxy-3-methylbut-2-en-1-yl diphosphate synthase IspG/GcpE
MTEGTAGFVAMKKSQCRLSVRTRRYMSSVMNIPITHIAITEAVVQPITLSHADKVKRAIMLGLLANFIITTIIGAAITPLMTALQ